MRYVVVGDYRAIREFRQDKGLSMQDIIPVPVAGPIWHALMGLHPEEVTIVLVYGSGQYMDTLSLVHIERFRAQGAQLLVMD